MTDDRTAIGSKWIIVLIALFAASKAILFDTLDPDCFWHLKVAEQLLRDGIGPLVDRLSFASIRTPWTPYSWLAELGMKAVWDAAGFRGAVLAQALLAAAFVWLVAACARLKAREKPLAVILATLAATYFSLPYLSFRPVTFALVLLALSTLMILADRTSRATRIIWLLPPLTIVLTNCHFYAWFVPMGLGALLLGDALERKPLRRTLTLTIATAAACCCTPMLRGTLATLAHYQFADPTLGGGFIAEFAPIYSGAGGVVTLTLLLAAAAWIARSDHVPLGEKLWGALLLLAAVRLGRFLPVLMPIGAALFAAVLPPLGGRALARRPIRALAACVLIGGTIRLFLALARPMSLDAWLNRNGTDVPGYPCAAADFVAARYPAGRIIDEFSWGGYLEWRLGPAHSLLLDGRTQLFTPDFWRKTYVGAEPSSALLHDANAVAAVTPIKGSRFKAALTALGWRSVHSDDRAEVLAPADDQSADKTAIVNGECRSAGMMFTVKLPARIASGRAPPLR